MINVCIWDHDERYAMSLARYMDQSSRWSMHGEVFTNAQALETYMQTHTVHIVLAGEAEMEQVSRQIHVCRICLAEEPIEKQIEIQTKIQIEKPTEKQTENGAATVYKYQSAEELLRRITAEYTAFLAQEEAAKHAAQRESAVNRQQETNRQETEGQRYAQQSRHDFLKHEMLREGMQQISVHHDTERKEPQHREMEYWETEHREKEYRETEHQESELTWDMTETTLIAVYSPIGRCGKTSFAITLGEILAFHHKVLYLNMEDYSGFAYLMNTAGEEDLSDLLYYFHVSEENLICHVNDMIRTWQRLDYVPPVFASGDLRHMQVSQWRDLWMRLAAGGAYDCIILDIGTQVENIFQLLKLCRHVYVPGLEEVTAKAKLQQFREDLEMLGGKILAERVSWLQLPEPGKEERSERLAFPERIVRGRMGDYVKKMLKNDENRLFGVEK